MSYTVLNKHRNCGQFKKNYKDMVDYIIVLKKICYLAPGEDYTSPILMAIRLDYVCDLLWLPKFNDVYHFPA